jgi:hypothetical protein
MRVIKFNFLLIISLILTLGMTTAVNGQNNKKIPKNMGVLTVKTTPVAYSVKVNGQFIGMSGVESPAEFVLEPGTHRLDVEFPDGKIFARDIQIVRSKKNCVCLRYVAETVTRPCPYDVRLEGPERVLEGDLITFAAFNAVSNSPTPLRYSWRVSPNARVTSGEGTSAITVDSAGMGGQTVKAELDVWDDVYDAKCRQRIEVPTIVEKQKIPEPRKFDEFPSLAFDDDKARLDTFVIELQNNPDSQGYIILYQGTDKNSMRLRNVEKLRQRTLDYLVKTRGLDPRRIWIVDGGSKRERTTYEMWIVPPGAQPPVPTQ